MVYITNWQFVNKYLKDITDIDAVLELFDVVRKLLKKYGRALKSNMLLEQIAKEDQSVADFINSLVSFDKLNIHDIDMIVRLLKKQRNDYTKSFSIWNLNYKSLELINKILKDKYWNIVLENEDIVAVWVTVVWEWKYFKRTVWSDLDKLLK